MSQSTHLPFETILALHEAAVSHGLAKGLETLLGGLPPEITDSLPDMPNRNPSERLLTVLHMLNAMSRTNDGTLALERVLKNAHHLTKNQIFANAHEEIRRGAPRTAELPSRSSAAHDLRELPQGERNDTSPTPSAHTPVALPDWIDIPEGPCWRGAVEGDGHAAPHEKPGGLVHVGAFRIMRRPVDVSNYQTFIFLKGYESDDWALRNPSLRFLLRQPYRWDEQQRRSDARLGERVPVTGISWWEAEAYCRYLNKMTPPPPGWMIRLPTEIEWEKAARGGEELASKAPSKRVEPWGSAPDYVGPYGTLGQLSGLWEWCQAYRPRAYLLGTDSLNLEDGDDPRAIRGGGDTPAELRLSHRGWLPPNRQDANVGFRCVMAKVAGG